MKVLNEHLFHECFNEYIFVGKKKITKLWYLLCMILSNSNSKFLSEMSLSVNVYNWFTRFGGRLNRVVSWNFSHVPNRIFSFNSNLIYGFSNWSTVDLQYCVSFRCRAKWSSVYIYTYIRIYMYILLNSFLLQFITRYWV